MEKMIDATLEKMRQESLPLKMCSWRIETGLDWTDDPAVWIWVYLERGSILCGDKAGKRIDLRNKRGELREKVVDRVWEAIKDEPGKSWIYVRFDEEELSPA